MTFQLRERYPSPSRLAINEIEIEGWRRSCGNPCLQKNAASMNDFLGTLDDTNSISTPGTWKLVRYVPNRNEWHDAHDYLL